MLHCACSCSSISRRHQELMLLLLLLLLDTAITLLLCSRPSNMPVQGLYECALLHGDWQAPRMPISGVTTVERWDTLMRHHEDLVEGIQAVRRAAAEEQRGRAHMVADLAAARQLFQLDQVGGGLLCACCA